VTWLQFQKSRFFVTVRIEDDGEGSVRVLD
jgi:hypothetical protein